MYLLWFKQQGLPHCPKALKNIFLFNYILRHLRTLLLFDCLFLISSSSSQFTAISFSSSQIPSPLRYPFSPQPTSQERSLISSSVSLENCINKYKYKFNSKTTAIIQYLLFEFFFVKMHARHLKTLTMVSSWRPIVRHLIN